MGLFDIFKGGASKDEIAYGELAAALQVRACVLIDARESHEFNAVRVPGSRNMLLSRFDPTKLPGDRPVALICRSGARMAGALARVRASGRKDVRHHRGGVIGWRRRAAHGLAARLKRPRRRDRR